MSLNNQHSNFTTNSNCNCKCGKPSVQRRVAKEGPNKGRSFLTCATSSCNFFQWLGPPQTSGMNVATDGEASACAIAIKAASRTNDAVGPTPLLLLYTDGSCLGNQNVVDKACPAGWAVVVVRPAGAAIEPRFSVATDLTVEHVPLSALHGSVGEHHYIGVKRSAEAVPEATASYSATEEVIEELYGTVELSQAGRGYMGATVGSNNTAELTAIGEAMLWLRDYYLPALLHRQYPDSFQTGAKSSGTDKLVSTQSTLTSDINKRRKLVASAGKAFCTPAIIFSRNATTAGQVPTPTRKIILRYDSEYAAKSVLGIWNGKKNTELIRTIRAYYREVQAMLERSNKQMKETKMLDPSSTLMPISLTFEHVKGHSNDRWNDLADELANRGAKGRTCVAGRYIN